MPSWGNVRWGVHARCELPVGYIRQISGMNHLIQYLRIRVMIAVGEQALCVQCVHKLLQAQRKSTHSCVHPCAFYIVHCSLQIVHYRLCIVCVECTLCIVHCLCIMQVTICNGPRVHQHQIGSRRAPLLCISRSLLPLTLVPQCLQ